MRILFFLLLISFSAYGQKEKNKKDLEQDTAWIGGRMYLLPKQDINLTVPHIEFTGAYTERVVFFQDDFVGYSTDFRSGKTRLVSKMEFTGKGDWDLEVIDSSGIRPGIVKLTGKCALSPGAPFILRTNYEFDVEVMVLDNAMFKFGLATNDFKDPTIACVTGNGRFNLLTKESGLEASTGGGEVIRQGRWYHLKMRYDYERGLVFLIVDGRATASVAWESDQPFKFLFALESGSVIINEIKLIRE